MFVALCTQRYLTATQVKLKNIYKNIKISNTQQGKMNNDYNPIKHASSAKQQEKK